jgi:flagellar biosynthesis protein FliQ
MSTSTPSSSSLGKRAIAVLILLVAAWIIVKAVIGIAVAVFWAVLVVVAVCALIWAIRVL